MAPDCVKHLDIGEINSMLLEELLGISNKRLTYIFNGEDVDRETSSSDSEDDKIDIISLDDISDDDNLELNVANTKQTINEDLDLSNKDKSGRRKSSKNGIVKIKKEKTKKGVNTKKEINKESEKSKLMSVLELLELQARARAIRSQLALEAENSKAPEKILDVKQEDSDSDAVIINNPSDDEIVITSESDMEHDKMKGISTTKALLSELSDPTTSSKNTELEIKQRKEKFLAKLQKIKLIRQKHTVTNSSDKAKKNCSENITNTGSNLPTKSDDMNAELPPKPIGEANSVCKKGMNCDNDEIVINLDDDEMESMNTV